MTNKLQMAEASSRAPIRDLARCLNVDLLSAGIDDYESCEILKGIPDQVQD